MISIEEFVSSLRVDAKERGRYEDDITAYKEYCDSNGLEVLNRNSKEAFIELIRPKRKTEKTVKATKSRIKKYIVSNEERSRQIMIDETKREPEILGANEPESVQAVEETSQAIDDGASTENSQVIEAETIAENEPESLPEPVKPEPNKGGRKRFDTEKGEKRSVKFMVYFTPSVMAELKDLCSMKHTTCANYLFELACREIEKNGEALAFFREGMSKLI